MSQFCAPPLVLTPQRCKSSPTPFATAHLWCGACALCCIRISAASAASSAIDCRPQNGKAARRRSMCDLLPRIASGCRRVILVIDLVAVAILLFIVDTHVLAPTLPRSVKALRSPPRGRAGMGCVGRRRWRQGRYGGSKRHRRDVAERQRGGGEHILRRPHDPGVVKRSAAREHDRRRAGCVLRACDLAACGNVVGVPGQALGGVVALFIGPDADSQGADCVASQPAHVAQHGTDVEEVVSKCGSR